MRSQRVGHDWATFTFMIAVFQSHSFPVYLWPVQFFSDRTHKKLIRSAGTQSTSVCLACRDLVRLYPAHLVAQVVKNLPARAKDSRRRFDPWGRGDGNGNPLRCSCLEKFHGQRSLAGYSPWATKIGHDWITEHNTYLFITWISPCWKIPQTELYVLIEDLRIADMSHRTCALPLFCTFSWFLYIILWYFIPLFYA